MSWTKRTPRSAIRRASRQLRAKPPSAPVSSMPYRSQDVLRLVGQVGQLRHRGLHAVGHLVLGDARVDLRVAERLGRQLVQLADAVEHAAARRGVDARRVGQVQHRVVARCGSGRPGAALGRKPLPQRREKIGWSVLLPLPCEIMTTNAGRFWFSLPRP